MYDAIILPIIQLAIMLLLFIAVFVAGIAAACVYIMRDYRPQKLDTEYVVKCNTCGKVVMRVSEADEFHTHATLKEPVVICTDCVHDEILEVANGATSVPCGGGEV